MSSSYEGDLFKKFKLKHHRTIQNTYEFDKHNNLINVTDGIVQDINQDCMELLTPDIDELKRQETDLLKCIRSPEVNHFKQNKITDFSNDSILGSNR